MLGETNTAADTTRPPDLDEAAIEAWARDPANRERARALGMRLVSAKDADALRAAPSLGAHEDAVTAWAILNPVPARLLVLKLLSVLM